MFPMILNFSKEGFILREEKVQFKMMFNKSRGIEKPFIVDVLYDKTKEMPLQIMFSKFENEVDTITSTFCPHNCVQNIQVRFFIKNVPENIKPFSLKLTICSKCGAPIAYKFIVYPGGLNSYPKMRDIHKFEDKRNVPKAVLSPEYKVGV